MAFQTHVTNAQRSDTASREEAKPQRRNYGMMLVVLFAHLLLAACGSPTAEPGEVRVAIVGGDRLLSVGASVVLDAVVEHGEDGDEPLEWSSSHPSIVAVESDSGRIEGLAAGSARVTVQSASTPVASDSIQVDVTEQEGVLRVEIEQGEQRLPVGGEARLSVDVTVTGGASPAVRWTSDDEAVVIVDSTGLLGAVGVGSTVVRAASVSDPAVYDEVSVAVVDASSSCSVQFGTDTGEVAYGVAVGPAGATVVAGHTIGILGETAYGGPDVFVRQLTSIGDVDWTLQFGTAEEESAMSVDVDLSGNVVVGGYTRGSMQGANAGSYDAYVTLIDSNGEQRWTRQFGTDAMDVVSGVAFGHDGQVYVVGFTNGDLASTSAGQRDGFLRKYDTEGNVVWMVQFGTIYNEYLQAGVDVDPNGNVYLAGHSLGAVAGTQVGRTDVFVLAFDADGNEVWGRQFGSASNDSAEAIVALPSGGVAVGGKAGDALPGQVSFGIADGFVRVYGPSGDLAWTSQFGTDQADNVRGLAADDDGHLYATGTTLGSLDGANAGDRDAFVRAFASNGQVVERHQFGSDATDWAHDVAILNESQYVVAGWTNGSLEDENIGSNDVFLRCYERP